MSSIKDAIEILGNLSNAPRVGELTAILYSLRDENLELKAKLKDLEAELKVNKEWEETKTFYQKFKTPNGAVVHIFTEESISDVFYCPTCIQKDKVAIPLQPLDMESEMRMGNVVGMPKSRKQCPSCKAIYNLGDAHYNPPNNPAIKL
jgi:rubrerythrin